MVVIYYGRNEKEAAVQGGAVLSSGEPDRASGVLLRPLRACMRINDIFTATYSPGSDPLVPDKDYLDYMKNHFEECAK